MPDEDKDEVPYDRCDSLAEDVRDSWRDEDLNTLSKGQNEMPLFSVNRKLQNRGCGDRSGRWLFEDFMFADSIFGRAAVEYGFSAHRIARCDRINGGAFYEPEIHSDPKVVECVIHDDDGNVVADFRTCAPEDRKMLVKAVLEAFEAAEYDVIEFEGGLL